MRDYAVQFLVNAGYFAAVIFLPLYAEGPSIGASEAQLGAIVAGGHFAGFVSSFVFGRLADIRGRRTVLLGGLAASSLFASLQVFAANPLVLGLMWLGFGFAFGSFPGTLLAYAYESGRPLGRFSSLGSLGWGFGTFLAGVVAVVSSNEKWSFLLASVLLLVAFVVSARIRFDGEVRLPVPRFPLAVMRRNWPVYAAIVVRHTGANMIWVIFPLFLAQDLGMSRFAIGVVYATNAVTQFVVMVLAVDRYGSVRLVFAGLALSALTFFTFTLAGNLGEIVATQIALGMSWAFLYVGALKFVLERGVERATSSGLLGSAISISATIGPLLGGVMSEAFQRTTPMYVASGLALTALGVFAIALRRQGGGSRVPSAPSGD